MLLPIRFIEHLIAVFPAKQVLNSREEAYTLHRNFGHSLYRHFQSGALSYRTTIMKKLLAFLCVQILLISSAYARDTVGNYSIDEALSIEKIKESLGTEVKFYFGDQKHPKIAKNFGEFRTNKKTNAFNKSDKVACQWVFLSALLSLKERAIREGGNAVVNVQSNYKNTLTSSTDSFQCGAGAVMAGVALVGTVVKVEK